MKLILSIINWFSLPASYPVDDVWFYIVVGVIIEALAVYLWPCRKMRGGLMAVISLFIAALWVFVPVFIAVSPGLPAKLFWLKVQQLSLIPMTTTWMMMMIEITGWNRLPIRTVHTVLIAIMGFFWLAVLTNDWHALFWADAVWDGTGMRFVRGPIFWTSLGYDYLQTALMIPLSVNWIFRSSGLRRWQSVVLAVSPIFIFIASIIWHLDQKFLSLPPLPMGVLLTSITAFWGFSRFRLFNLVPQAQATVSRNLGDGLIIIDNQDYIVEINPVAQKMCNMLNLKLLDGNFQQIFAGLPLLCELGSSRETKTVEGFLDGSGRCYQLYVTQIFDGWKRFLGKIILLKDITEAKQAQTQLVEQQKTLSIMEERDRLARELHDSLGQVMGY